MKWKIVCYEFLLTFWEALRHEPFRLLLYLIELLVYLVFMSVTILFRVLLRAPKWLRGYFRVLVFVVKTRNVEELENLISRTNFLHRREFRRKMRVRKKADIRTTAVHEAGHVVLALQSPDQREQLVNAIVWKRAKKNENTDTFKMGAMRAEASYPYTKDTVLAKLATLYAGELATRCLLRNSFVAHSVTDQQKATELSSLYASIVATGPLTAACYAWYLEVVARQRARNTLIQEQRLVFAIARRLARTPDQPVFLQEIVEIESAIKGLYKN